MTICRLSFAGVALVGAAAACADDPLPSWNDGESKAAIVDFVERVTTKGSDDYVAPAERVAVFDNDGTLWAEKPVYSQLLFAMDRVRELAPGRPEWEDQEPFASVLRGEPEAALAGGKEAIMKLVMASHAGMTVDEFDRIAMDWIAEARHPETDRPYTRMVYEPMLEVLWYLRANGFKTFIVSGGGIDFMRPWVGAVYGVPPERVVGSSVKVAYEERDGVPTLVRQAEVDFIDDKAGKPVGIQRHIGRRPILAFGNSDGDYEMLRYTTAGDGPALGVLIHHTDGEREWAYDRDSPVGKLDRALDEAPRRGWVVVDMKDDWARVFPAE